MPTTELQKVALLMDINLKLSGNGRKSVFLKSQLFYCLHAAVLSAFGKKGVKTKDLTLYENDPNTTHG